MRIPASRARNADQAGTVLVLFALLVFALLAIASLTIDVGYAFLAQAQMQNAVDTGAVEGARLRDYNVEQWLSNRSRRARTSEIVRQTFDDDLHPAGEITYFYEPWLDMEGDSNGDQGNFSAGPQIRLVGGDAQDNIGALIDTSSNGYLDDPLLQPNSNNNAHGDMLNGQYLPDAAHAEAANYVRPDFLPANVNDYDLSAGNFDALESLGFLVRMRRTTQENGLDDQAGVSTSGPTVPFIFGLGAPIHQASGSSYNPRTDGLTVRATAIAAASPALSVGYPPCRDNAIFPDAALGYPIMGFYGVVLSREYWEAVTELAGHLNWSTHCHELILNEATGALTLNSIAVCSDTTPITPPAWVAPFVGTVVAYLVDRGNVVGDLVFPVSLQQFQSGVDRDNDGEISAQDQASAHCRWLGLSSGGGIGQAFGEERGFLGVFDPIANPDASLQNRVTGFAFGRAVFAPGNSGTGVPSRIIVSPGLANPHQNVDCWVAQDNASPHLSIDADDLAASVWSQVIDKTYQFALRGYSVDPELALSRRYDYTRIKRGVLLAATLVR